MTYEMSDETKAHFAKPEVQAWMRERPGCWYATLTGGVTVAYDKQEYIISDEPRARRYMTSRDILWERRLRGGEAYADESGYPLEPGAALVNLKGEVVATAKPRVTLADLRKDPGALARVASETRNFVELGEPRTGAPISFTLSDQHHTGTLAHHYGDGFCIVDVTGTGYCVAVKELREPTSEPEQKPDPYKSRHSEKMIADMMAERNKAFVPRFGADVEPRRRIGEVAHPWELPADWELGHS